MNIYGQIASNKRKTFFLIFGFLVFAIVFGYIISLFFDFGLLGLGIFLVIFGIITYVSYYNSDKMVLSLSHAKPVKKEDYPQLYNIVENLSIGLGQAMPKIYVIEDGGMNAFATGRDPLHSAVAATTGLLQALDKQELEGVMAHELSHVRNYDIRLLSLVTVLAGSIAIISDFFLRSLLWGGSDRKSNGILIVIALIAAILAPIAAGLIQLSVSRNREYLADASGALLTRYPEGLASALEKISKHPKLKHATHANAHMFIESPFGEKAKDFFSNLYSTHPPATERIKRLRAM
jgi:heat shock protein HtpX